MNNKTNSRKAKEEADCVLLSSNQFEFPLNIEKLLKDIKIANIKIYMYSDTGISESKKLKNSGFVTENNGIYYVLYNDTIENEGNYRFTLCHELGHIMLQHDLTKPNDRVQEAEADTFASELLMPESVIFEIKNRGYVINKKLIKELFNASNQASQIRVEEFNKFPECHSKYIDCDSIINIQFKSFLDKKYPRINYFDFDIDNELEEQRRRDTW